MNRNILSKGSPPIGRQWYESENPLRMVKVGLLFVLAMLPNDLTAQVVNAYAKVTAISGSVLTLSNVNESNHTFTVGEQVIIMQMQDNVIGGTSNDVNFGNLGSISSAGRYEIKTISARTATSITINGGLAVTYNTGTNSSVQIISFRLFGNPNYSTSADMAALPWDGNIGGVLAIQVNGTLTLNNNLTANSAGFRGGGMSANGSTVECNGNYTTNNNTIGGEKGEGIYKRTNAAFQYARGKIISGGGGGNRHNAGGGGGGNYSAGGDGGAGYNCTSTPAGGIGGLSLQSYINTSRIFIGGGGGGGQQNNSVATAGANGGGIILVKAIQLITPGSCSGINISANGGSSANAGDDGTGGAGAGGSIILDIPTINVPSSCPLNVAANGGNAGSSLNSTAHGGGGGGGQGYVAYTASTITNVTINTNIGSSGCNNNSSPCNSQVPAPAGSGGSGVTANPGGTPLPITLLIFKGRVENKEVILSWSTVAEINNDFFVVERTLDGKTFEDIKQIDGAGNSNTLLHYETLDEFPPHGKVYYRLRQVDFDGQFTRSKLIAVDILIDGFSIQTSPNPVKAGTQMNVRVMYSQEITGNTQFALTDALGKSIPISMVKMQYNFWSLKTSTDLAPGIYYLRAQTSQGDRLSSQRILFLP